MATPILNNVTGSTTGDATERIGQNATIAGTGITSAGNPELLIRNPNDPDVEVMIGGDFIELEGQTVNRDWLGITAVEDILYAVVAGGRIYSRDRNVDGDFVQLSGQTVNRNWLGITAVEDILYAVVTTNRIYYRDRNVDGDFIELEGQTVNRDWRDITAVGDILYAIDTFGGRIYYRDRNVDGDFIELEGQTVNRDWRCITAVGDILYATVFNGRIYYRDRNVDGDFIELEGQTVNRGWQGITAVGDILYAVVSRDLIYYRDRNVDGDFIELEGQTLDRVWRDITAVGNILYATVTIGDKIYKSHSETALPWQNITPQIQSTTETEVIFETPEFELGNYKLAVENNDGLSNELDFTILDATPPPTLTEVIGSTTGNNTEHIDQNATLSGDGFTSGGALDLLIRDPVVSEAKHRYKFEDNLLDAVGDADGTATNAVYANSTVPLSTRSLAFNVATATTPEYYKVTTDSNHQLTDRVSVSFWAKGLMPSDMQKIEVGAQYEIVHAIYAHENIVLVGMGSDANDASIYRSDDHGVTLTKVHTSKPNSELIYDIKYIGNDMFFACGGRTVEFGSAFLIFSVDRGVTWNEINDVAFNGPDVRFVATISECVGGVFYVATNQLISGTDRTFVYRFTEYGESFSLASALPTNGDASQKIIQTSNGNVILAIHNFSVNQSKIIKSSNNGVDFITISSGLSRIFRGDISDSGVIAFSGNSGNVYTSTNGGDSFATTNTNLLAAIRDSFCLSSGVWVHAGVTASGNSNVVYSDDNNATFKALPRAVLPDNAFYLAESGRYLCVGGGAGSDLGDLFLIPTTEQFRIVAKNLLSHKSAGYDAETPLSNSVQIKLVDSPFFGYMFEYVVTRYNSIGVLETIVKAVFKAQDYYTTNSIADPTAVDSSFTFIFDRTAIGNARARLIVFVPTKPSATLEPESLFVSDINIFADIQANWELAPDLGLPFAGSYNFQIDDLRIYNGTLTSAEIADIQSGETATALSGQPQWQNITSSIQSTTDTEIVFTTPEVELGAYKLAVENDNGLSNELDFTVLQEIVIPEPPEEPPNDFNNLYWLVRVNKFNGSPYFTGPAQTLFNLVYTTIPFGTYYRQSPYAVRDGDLDIGSIDWSFEGNVWDGGGTSKINDVTFSVANFDDASFDLYGSLQQINTNPSLFVGDRVRVYICNGLVPGALWDADASTWRDLDGNDIVGNAPSDYTSEDYARVVFDGYIDKVNPERLRLTFDCLSNSKRQDVVIGELADPLSDAKDRDKMIPIVFGDMTDSDAAIPIIQERTPDTLPVMRLDSKPIEEWQSTLVYDKDSQRLFEAVSSRIINDDNNRTVYVQSTGTNTAVGTFLTFADIDQQPSIYRDILTSDDKTKKIIQIGDEQIAIFINPLQITPVPPGSTNTVITSEGVFFNGQFLSIRTPTSRGYNNTPVTSHPAGDLIYKLGPDVAARQIRVRLNLPIDWVQQTQNNTIDIALDEGAPLSEARPCKKAFGGDLWGVISASKQQSSSSFPLSVSSWVEPRSTGVTSRGTGEVDLFLIPERVGLDGDIVFGALRVRGGWSTPDYPADIVANELRFFIRDGDIEHERVSFDELPANSSDTFSSIDGPWLTVPALESAKTIKNLYDLPVRQNARTSFTVNLDSYKPAKINFSAYNFIIDVIINSFDYSWFARAKGRIKTGTATAALNAYDVINQIQKDELGGSNILSTLANTTTKLSGSISGARPMWRNVLRQMCYESFQMYIESPEGVKELISLDKKANPDYVIGDNDLLLGANNLTDYTYNQTGYEDIYNKFEFRYRYNDASKRFTRTKTFTSSKADAVVGAGNPDKTKIIDFYYVRDDADVDLLSSKMIPWFEQTHYEVSFSVPYSLGVVLTQGKQIGFDIETMSPMMRSRRYLITGARLNTSTKRSNGSVEVRCISMP